MSNIITSPYPTTKLSRYIGNMALGVVTKMKQGILFQLKISQYAIFEWEFATRHFSFSLCTDFWSKFH